MDFPASLPARLFGRAFVCPFGKSLQLLRKAKPCRFGFHVPSSASESQALFRYSRYSVANSETMGARKMRREYPLSQDLGQVLPTPEDSLEPSIFVRLLAGLQSSYLGALSKRSFRGFSSEQCESRT